MGRSSCGGLRQEEAPAEAGKPTGECWASSLDGEGTQTQKFRSEDLRTVFGDHTSAGLAGDGRVTRPGVGWGALSGLSLPDRPCLAQRVF